MKVNIVTIGNSKGIRIPKAMLEQCNFTDQAELEVRNSKLVIAPVRGRPREGWSEAFKSMRKKGEDRLIVDDSTDLEMKEWEW
jgi:antitoxin MazE